MKTVIILLIAGLSIFAKSTVAQPGSEDLALQKKLQPYIQCINRHSERATDSHIRYLSWIKKPDKGPTGRERVIYGLYTLYDPTDCVAALNSATEVEPQLVDLESAGQQFGTALQSLFEITNTANDYYELEDYRDDKMKQGKAMHPDLMAAFETFDEADNALRAALTAENDRLQLRILERLEAEQGQSLGYHIQNVSIRAKFLVRAGSVNRLKDLNGEVYQPALEAYEAAFRGLRSFAAENPEVMARVSLYTIVEMAAMEYLKTGKTLWRYHRDKRRWTSGERMFINDGSGDMVEGHPARLIRDYNTLVERINML